MRIDSLYIASFGGIKNLKLDFSDNFNVVLGQNENGKTTIMAFIKMMFYGNERGGNSLSKNIRKKYTPWNGDRMAGSIDFTLCGKHYRLEKEFRSSNSTDKTTLFDLDLSEGYAVASDIGSKLLGVSAAAFERSAFIGQFGFPEKDTDAEGEISGKLSNLSLTGDENISFDEVHTRLQKAKLSLMSKSGKAGIYDKNLLKLEEISNDIKNAENAKQVFESKKSELQQIVKEITLLADKSTTMKNQLSKEEDCRNAEKFKRLLALKEELEQEGTNLKLRDGKLIDDIYLSKIKFCLSKLEKAKSCEDVKLGEIDVLKKSIDNAINPPENATEENRLVLTEKLNSITPVIDELEQNIALNQKALNGLEAKIPEAELSKKAFNPLLLIISAVLILAGAGLFLVSKIIGIAGLFAGIILLVLSFVIKPHDTSVSENLRREILTKKEKLIALQNEKSATLSELSSIKSRLDAVTAALNASAQVLESQKEMLNSKLSELSILRKDTAEAKQELINVFAAFKTTDSVDEIIAILPTLKEKADKIKQIKTELNIYVKELGSISYEEAESKLALIENGEQTDIDFAKLKLDYENIITEITNKKEYAATLTAELNHLKELYKNLENSKAQAELLKETLAKQNDYCEALSIADEVLTDSFSEVHSSYGAVLEKRASEIFAKLTLDKYNSMSISKGFDIAVRQSTVFGTRDVAFLSSGAYDQAYLSLRLAVAELISENEALPILLDDSLAQYDDIRTEKAMEFLKEYSEKHQTIMFTCHKHIKLLADENKANVIRL